MIYFQARYVKTETGRVLKLDGWNPVAECVGGVWMKNGPINSDEVLSARELSPSEMEEYFAEASDNLDSDNVDVATMFANVVMSSSSIKFFLIATFYAGIENVETPHNRGPLSFDEQTREKIWMECVCASYAYFRSCSFLIWDTFDDRIGIPFVKYGVYSWLRAMFPKTKLDPFEVQKMLEGNLIEYDKAASDFERVERLFSGIKPYRDGAKDRHWTERVYFCLLQRIHDRLEQYPEDFMPHDSEAGLIISDDFVFNCCFIGWALKTYLKTIMSEDSDAVDTVDKELAKIRK